jgi:hypothetical protein
MAIKMLRFLSASAVLFVVVTYRYLWHSTFPGNNILNRLPSENMQNHTEIDFAFSALDIMDINVNFI